MRAADSLARLNAKEPRKAIRMARLFVQGGVTIGEIEKATTPASPSPSRSSSAARAVDLRVTAEGIHLLIGLKHRPVKSRIVCENEIELLHFSYATFFSALGSSSLTSRYCL